MPVAYKSVQSPPIQILNARKGRTMFSKTARVMKLRLNQKETRTSVSDRADEALRHWIESTAPTPITDRRIRAVKAKKA